MIQSLRIVRRAFYAALSPLVPLYAGLSACYYKVATDAMGLAHALTSTPPTCSGAIVFFSQDAGGAIEPVFGAGDWAGNFTIRCVAGTLDAAEALLATIPIEMTATPTGYAFRATFLRPLDLPTIDGVHSAAAIYRVQLTRII